MRNTERVYYHLRKSEIPFETGKSFFHYPTEKMASHKQIINLKSTWYYEELPRQYSTRHENENDKATGHGEGMEGSLMLTRLWWLWWRWRWLILYLIISYLKKYFLLFFRYSIFTSNFHNFQPTTQLYWIYQILIFHFVRFLAAKTAPIIILFAIIILLWRDLIKSNHLFSNLNEKS